MAISMFLIATLLIILRLFKLRALSPCGILAVYWLFFIIGSLVLLNDDYIFGFGGINWILIAVIAFVFGFLLVSLTQPQNYNKRTSTIIKPNIPWNILVLFYVLAFGNVAITVSKFGIDMSSIGGFMELQDAARESAVYRYSGSDLSLGFVGQILGCFLYAAPACAGYSWIEADTWKKRALCVCSFAPALISMFLTTGKLSVLSAVLLFFAGYYTSYLYERKKEICLKFNAIIKYAILGILLISAFIFSLVSRIGRMDNIGVVEIVMGKMEIYAFGHVQGFDTWFMNRSTDAEQLGLGTHTFLAISSRFGSYEKKQGVYDIIQGSCTNVYTSFRGLIEDFGMVGAVLLMFLMGILVACFYTNIKRSYRKQIGSQVGMIISLFCILDFIVSPFTYTTYILAFLIIAWFVWYAFNAKKAVLKIR